ncbi:AbrB family transcriptional regulator [Deferribacterales bacterium RsTz2092]|nr:ammonia monooxygenase [Deferribacterales bacterium]
MNKRIICSWVGLVVLSVACTAGLLAVHAPAALMLGSMIAGVLLAIKSIELHVPDNPMMAVQAIIGAMIADSIPGDVLGELSAQWTLVLAGTLWAIVMCILLSLFVAKHQFIPGTNAIWGCSPGGATVMMLMSGAYGADMRIVGFMQYFRVICVVLLASLVAHIWGDPTTGSSGHIGTIEIQFFTHIELWEFAKTIGLILLSIVIAWKLHFTSGPTIIAIVLCLVAQNTGLVKLELPMWLLAISYAIVGWGTGLRFTRQLLLAVFHALPQICLITAMMIALCSSFIGVLVFFAGTDPLTAYLALSPGGVDSVAIIAASCDVDVPFIMSMQVGRLILVILSYPHIAQYMSKKIKFKEKSWE